MKLLTNEQQKTYESAKTFMFVKNILKINILNITREYRDATHSTCNLNYSVPKKNSYSFMMNLTMIIIL